MELWHCLAGAAFVMADPCASTCLIVSVFIAAISSSSAPPPPPNCPFPSSPGFILQRQNTIGSDGTGARPSPRFITRGHGVRALTLPAPRSSHAPGQTRGDGAAPGLIYNHRRTEFPSPVPVCRLIDGRLCFLPCTHVGVLLFRECNYMLIQPGQHVCLSGLSENSRVVSGDLSTNALHYITNFSSHSLTHTLTF